MKGVIIYLIAAIVGVSLSGVAVMLLYNGVLVNILPTLGKITYFESVGLYMLCNMLFRYVPFTIKEN